MTKIDIFSGFLGAGKTTLIKKLIKEAYAGEKIVLIENEFGEIGIDGGFLRDAGIKINELNSGCICCSLVGDFAASLKKVYAEYRPDRILIEPSGVGKLSDVIRAVHSAELVDCTVNSATAVVDAGKCKMYMKNFGEFFNDQIATASCIIFSHVDIAGEEKLENAIRLVRESNPYAAIVTTDYKLLSGKKIVAAMEKASTLESELEGLKEEQHHHGHEHEHHHEGEECCCGHHHGHDDHEHGHEHEHHQEGEECCCGHHHDHDDHDHHEHHCDHGHGHEHHHHADEVFASWGVETSKKFNKDALAANLSALSDAVRFGTILRAKGIVPCECGKWLHFDYIPGQIDIREGSAEYTGRLCVIGSKIDEEELKELFGV